MSFSSSQSEDDEQGSDETRGQPQTTSHSGGPPQSSQSGGLTQPPQSSQSGGPQQSSQSGGLTQSSQSGIQTTNSDSGQLCTSLQTTLGMACTIEVSFLRSRVYRPILEFKLRKATL